MLKSGGFFLALQFCKPALPYDQQADLLLKRGLIADRVKLIGRLRAVGYYRLCAYWHPFKQPDETFKGGTTLDIVWERYTFDRQLRLALIDAIERVEVAVRTSLIHTLALQGGPFVHVSVGNFPNVPTDQHRRFIDDLRDDAQRSSEVFVEHFKSTYDEFPDLPIWAAAEIMTFGMMFTLFRMSGKHVQVSVASRYKLSGKVLFNWLLTLNYVRNLCAHHARLWNRELAIRPMIPDQKHDPRWHRPVPIGNRRLFSVLTLLRYLLVHIEPRTHWRERLFSTFDRFPGIPLASMEMPPDWRAHDLWR